jgi:hypothetical protein
MQWTSTGSPTQALADSFLAAGTVLLVVCREQLLQLPHNSAAFSLLQDRGLHPAYKGLAQTMQAGSGETTNTVANRLTACLSQLAHWCPLFGELPPAPCTDNGFACAGAPETPPSLSVHLDAAVQHAPQVRLGSCQTLPSPL